MVETAGSESTSMEKYEHYVSGEEFTWQTGRLTKRDSFCVKNNRVKTFVFVKKNFFFVIFWNRERKCKNC